MNKIYTELTHVVREMYAERDFKFFLQKNIKENNYPQSDIDQIHAGYDTKKLELIKEVKLNKRQTLLYLDGIMLKLVNGGFLTSLFGLNETRKLIIIRFFDCGTDWAYFDLWQKYERKRMFKKKLWSGFTKVKSIFR